AVGLVPKKLVGGFLDLLHQLFAGNRLHLVDGLGLMLMNGNKRAARVASCLVSHSMSLSSNFLTYIPTEVGFVETQPLPEKSTASVSYGRLSTDSYSILVQPR